MLYVAFVCHCFSRFFCSLTIKIFLTKKNMHVYLQINFCKFFSSDKSEAFPADFSEVVSEVCYSDVCDDGCLSTTDGCTPWTSSIQL